MTRPKPLLLIILDGFGISLEKEGNPLAEARLPTFHAIEQNYPFTTLQASGGAVGLPWGEAGNSEVGHLTIGAGRVIYHHLPRIITSIHDGSFFENPALVQAAEYVIKNNTNLHIAGLVSSGSVHAYVDHLYALLDLLKERQVPRVYLHIFSDGKDAPPNEGAVFIARIEKRLATDWPNTAIATIIGRSFALDRDEQWKRVETAYDLLTQGKGTPINSASAYLAASYESGIFDEFIEPAFVTQKNTNEAADSEQNKPLALIRDNDALIFTDFREDSMREITHAFSDEVFDKFPRRKIMGLDIVTMTEYQKGLPVSIAFPSLDIEWPLSRAIGDAGLTHAHIAETQKYAHVTYFFNGGVEQEFPGERRILIPSITSSHFNDVPAMSAAEVTAAILEHLATSDVIIANFANADMVGHTGDFKASVQAAEILDEAISTIMNALSGGNGVMLITGDHGNIERKRNTISGEPLTEHSINPVPLYLVGKQFKRPAPRTDEQIARQKSQTEGVLTDVAPTVLDLLDLPKPKEMTGESLLAVLLKQ
ncbi:MAG: 2,3-bisphosphoglycerate-independent phosphoglycerate mutase [Candidatus Sungbacteria bacterium]|nr:2,3-bisphosphoglycerate-independent phosphoglycerate mutase [Candidatus Sungbacteria bacterium]